MKPIIKLLRSAGYMPTVYLDDWYLVGRSYAECKDNFNTTVKLLTSLGFKINFEKSSLKPSRTCKFLGFIIDSNKLQISYQILKKLILNLKF